MKSNPLGAMFSDLQNPDQKYATVVLESISCLETTQNLFLKQNNPYMNQTLLTNQFRNLLNNIYSSPNPAPSMELINNLNKYAFTHKQDLNQCNNPYMFLYFLLAMLDEEYNNAFRIQINLNQEFPSLELAANFFNQIYESQNTSIILKNYNFSLIMSNMCNSCKNSKIKPVFKKTIDLNVDSYLQQNNGNPISISECLQYYFIPKTVQCQNCGQPNVFQSRILLKTGPVIIINLMRNNYTGFKDQNFTLDMNIDLSKYKQNKNEGNNTYTLKSCICFSQYGFYTDCFIKRDNMEGDWFRYMNKDRIQLPNNRLFDNQPVLLFYECSDKQNNINNMNVINVQNMNYNNQNNMPNNMPNNMQNINMNNQDNQNINMNAQNVQNNEDIDNKFDIISNFPLNLKLAIEEEFHNFDFDFGISENNDQSNFDINSNFNNYQNQVNNYFDNVQSQPQNMFNQMNQINNEMNQNNNINQQDLNNNNNFNQNQGQIQQNLGQIQQNQGQIQQNQGQIQQNQGQIQQNQGQNENKDEKVNDNKQNPFSLVNQNMEQNMNENMNNMNMNSNFQNNQNMNMNQEFYINEEINKNVIPGFNNLELNKNQNNDNNNLQKDNMKKDQENISDLNQNQQFNAFNNNQMQNEENLSQQIYNEMKNNIQNNHINANEINLNENINLNKEENKPIQPEIQQNNFMHNNNIMPNVMNNNMNLQENKNVEMPQMPFMNIPQNQNLMQQINNQPPESMQNLNNENQNKFNNQMPQQVVQPINMPVNHNQNNFNEIPKSNIPIKINEPKKEEPKLIMPKPIPKNEIKKDEPKKEIKKEEPKKDVKQNEAPKIEKKMSMQERIKLMSGGIKLNPNPQPAAPKKRLSNEIKFNPQPFNDKKSESQPNPIGGIGEKMKNMKAMLEKKGGFGMPRPSAQMFGMPRGFSDMMINKNNNNSGNGPIAEEREDMEKKLDKIVVQKKKKSKKPTFNDE